MTDFFVSYTHPDRQWAEWIAFVLEEEGYTTIIQAWDFRPGSNFVLEMQQAAATAKRTVMVLSPAYLTSKMAAPEWASAFAQDPQGLERKLIPIMVRECKTEGLLPTIVQARLMGMDEATARQTLVAGVKDERAKPSHRPGFPGGPSQVDAKTFPGSEGQMSQPQSQPQRSSLLPKMKMQWTDRDRRQFLKQGFETIRQTFEANLQQVTREESRLEFDFTPSSATDFSAELFLDGNSKCKSRIWIDNAMGHDKIAVQEGRTSGNGYNEMLAPSLDGELVFSASMGTSFQQSGEGMNLKQLSPDDAATYLWERFVKPLSY
ncbi:toll/interleukin-1 receptor domain-containing protein [Rhizobium sp. DKSPLA3]|uniref:Toll/interleukin-1 receptor domain-containing protein n=1 Tax=Rhizobium quercicola TaxID=2901226 RepID=A0A9X1NXK8_9HYPH|nr:toll/interleukin-1 receptor domain-containing protein [Rhizobium quercicola]MCD7111811.1 toll/interleukin-1 receptor domain-containing protein [Rhizobium quercicola]